MICKMSVKCPEINHKEMKPEMKSNLLKSKYCLKGAVRRNLIFITLWALYAVSGPGYAQNYISGDITRNTRWQGMIYINGDVIIPQGVTLIIETGTRIYFKPLTDSQKSGKDKDRSELIVNGVVIASSSPGNPILFTSEAEKPQMNDWYGITIKNFFEHSQLENCIIEFGYKGITCYGSSPQISGGEFRFNHNSGISCEVKSNPVIRNALIFGNGFAGINCELASNPVISGCTISENNYGIMVLSRSAPDLGTLPLNDQNSRGENRISNNFDFDIYNHSASNINAQNNIWPGPSASLIQAVIYDRQDNSSYGEVVFLPIFQERRIAVQYPVSIASAATPAEISGAPARDTLLAASIPLVSASRDTTVQIPDSSLKDTSFAALLISQPQSLDMRDGRSADYTPSTHNPANAAPPAELVIQQPVLELFLDSKKREYRRRATPVYPKIYQQTGTEGDVLIEVWVNTQGGIDDFRVIKSDGEYFTESAVSALKKFIYKTGTVNGKPVSFKIIERFRFKLHN